MSKGSGPTEAFPAAHIESRRLMVPRWPRELDVEEEVQGSEAGQLG